MPDKCPDCGGNKKEDYPNCYKCSMKKKGYVECPNDGCDGYRDPKFPECYNCAHPK